MRPALRGRIIIAAALGIAVVIGLTVWHQVGGSGTSARLIESGTALSPDRVDLNASIIRVDPSSGEMLLRLLVTPRGSLTTEAGLSPLEDLEIQTSPDMKSDPYFPALKRIGTVDVPVVLSGNGVTAYPFDNYHVTLEFAAKMGGQDVPVHLTLTNRDALFGASATLHTDAGAAITELELARSAGVLTFAIFMIIAMWALAVSVVTGAWHVVSNRRGLLWPALGWMAATLFAIAGFRNAAPGSPPIGSLIDYIAFFWAEAVIATSVVAVVIGGVRAELDDQVAEKASADQLADTPGLDSEASEVEVNPRPV